MEKGKGIRRWQAVVLALVMLLGAAADVVPAYAKTVKASSVDEISFEKKNGKTYGVDEDGNTVSGWSGDKTYYFYKDGRMAAGIVVMKEKFYAFGSDGVYNEEKTKKLRRAAKYEAPFKPLEKLIGKPKKAKYYASCYGDGKDGILTYKGFTVYTFKPNKGEEIFMGAE